MDELLRLAAHAGARQPPAAYDALIGGLQTAPALISHTGRQWGVQLTLTPLGARAFLGLPAAALASWDADLTRNASKAEAPRRGWLYQDAGSRD